MTTEQSNKLIVKGLRAAMGAQFLIESLFVSLNTPARNNDNYCNLVDWMKDAIHAVNKTQEGSKLYEQSLAESMQEVLELENEKPND